MLSVGLVHVKNKKKLQQNPHAAVFASCPDEKQVTVIDFGLGTSRSGYVTIVPDDMYCSNMRRLPHSLDVKLCIGNISLFFEM